MTLNDLLSVKTVVNVPTVSTGNKQKNVEKKQPIFCCYLEATEDKEQDPEIDP